MLIGLARTSTLDQEAGLEAQNKALTKAGVEKLFVEQTSSVGPRPVLEGAIEFSRDGDVLVATDLSRVARSVMDFCRIQSRLAAKGVELRILNIGMDTSTPTGKLMLNVVAAVAQFEREMMLERQREGVAKAKAEKRYKGRAPLRERNPSRSRAWRPRTSKSVISLCSLGSVSAVCSESLALPIEPPYIRGLASPTFPSECHQITTRGRLSADVGSRHDCKWLESRQML